MALSVLKINYSRFGLYCSKKRSFILSGQTADEMYQWKNMIELLEQAEANKDHLAKLREDYLGLLTAPGSGNTIEDATEFLRGQMPFLFLQG